MKLSHLNTSYGNFVMFEGERTILTSTPEAYPMVRIPCVNGYDNLSVDWEDVTPIETTDKLLVEIGFERKSGTYGNDPIVYFQFGDIRINRLPIYGYCHGKKNEPYKYIHEVQNLILGLFRSHSTV